MMGPSGNRMGYLAALVAVNLIGNVAAVPSITTTPPAFSSRDGDQKMEFVFITDTPLSHCRFTTPDGFQLEDLHCTPDDVETCLNAHPKDPTDTSRPDTWSYQFKVSTDLERDCGIQVNRVSMPDNGVWTAEVCDGDTPADCTTGHVSVSVEALSFSDNAPDRFVEQSDPTDIIFRTSFPMQVCQFQTPDGFTLSVEPGNTEPQIAPPEMRVARPPPLWTYAWVGTNSSDLDCGIKLGHTVPADDGMWTCMASLEGSQPVTATVNVDVSTFEVEHSPEPVDVDDGDAFHFIFRTNAPYDFCEFWTPDGQHLHELECHPDEDVDICLRNYTLPGDSNRPDDLWNYVYHMYNDTKHDCGVKIQRAVVADQGMWTVLVQSPYGENYTEQVMVTVNGQRIVAQPEVQVEDKVVGDSVSFVFRSLIEYDTCTVFTPQGEALVMQPGNPTQFPHPTDSSRPAEFWTYNWNGFNETRRDCGIRLNYVLPQDNGDWTVRFERYGSATVEGVHTVRVPAYGLDFEPIHVITEDAQKGVMVFRANFRYTTCQFTTPDGHQLEPLGCHPVEDAEACLRQYNNTWGDPERPEGIWTYQYQFSDDFSTDFECGIQLNRVVNEDHGNWSVHISSVTGDVVQEVVLLEVRPDEFTFAPGMYVGTEGQPIEMYFRSMLPHEVCSFVTPDGHRIDLEQGIPTEHTKDWADQDGRDPAFWKYAWTAYNTSYLDCGLRLTHPVAADDGVWQVIIGKSDGASDDMTQAFSLSLQASTTAGPGQTTTTAGSGVTTTAGSGVTTTAGSGQTTTAGSGQTTTAGSGETTTGSDGGAGNIRLSALAGFLGAVLLAITLL